MLDIDQPARSATPLGEALGADGYIRLSASRLRAIGFIHLLSGLDVDPDDRQEATEGATVAAITGFTEWASVTVPALSLGWDWLLEIAGRELRYLRIGEPRGNIMLISHESRDLGFDQNALALGLTVDEWHWQEAVARFVRTRYA